MSRKKMQEEKSVHRHGSSSEADGLGSRNYKGLVLSAKVTRTTYD